MKKLLTFATLIAVLVLSGCHRDQTPQPSTQHNTITSTAVEDSLIGKWFVKQTSSYIADTLFNPLTVNYNNAQQYVQFNSDLDQSIQTNFPGAKTSIWSPMGSAQNVSWKASGTVLNAPASSPTYRITYLMNDSLVLDYGFSADSSSFSRYTLHK